MPKEPTDVLNMAKELHRRLQAKTLEAGGVAPEIGVAAETVPCDLVETADAFHLTLDLPGVKKEDVKLSIQGRRINVTATKSRVPEDETRRAVMVEGPSGILSRTIEVPEAVDENSAKIDYIAGVLSVFLKKKTG